MKEAEGGEDADRHFWRPVWGAHRLDFFRSASLGQESGKWARNI